MDTRLFIDELMNGFEVARSHCAGNVLCDQPGNSADIAARKYSYAYT